MYEMRESYHCYLAQKETDYATYNDSTGTPQLLQTQVILRLKAEFGSWKAMGSC